MSPSYHYILPSVLRISGQSLMSTTYSTNVSVSTFNSTNLTMSNNLVIYSFLAGYIIQSQNSILEFQASSQILDKATIKVSISSAVNLISVTSVRIDTVVIDQTQIETSKLVTLDFVTADCPTCTYSFTVPAFTGNDENFFTGIS